MSWRTGLLLKNILCRRQAICNDQEICSSCSILLFFSSESFIFWLISIKCIYKLKMGRCLIKSYGKAPMPSENLKKSRDNTTTITKNDYTTIMEGSRTCSQSNLIYAIKIVWLNQLTGSQPSYKLQRCIIKRTYIQTLVNDPPYRDQRSTANSNDLENRLYFSQCIRTLSSQGQRDNTSRHKC